jgi:hypothetical protein
VNGRSKCGESTEQAVDGWSDEERAVAAWDQVWECRDNDKAELADVSAVLRGYSLE